MSRVGLAPVEIPGGVTVAFDKAGATVKGPKGTITKALPGLCEYKQEENVVRVSRRSEDQTSRSMHGLARTLLANMVEGVTKGFYKQLEIVGVGYKAEAKGKNLVLTVGFSHPVMFEIPEGISIETPAPTQIKVSGIEKDRVGQVAADIRKVRPPEPYKGKGIKYVGEQIQRKAGKTAAGA
ncbi:MAG: 50S ribosomal protein L6 [Candidatus Krumholzibacteria bacterium]|nr:50S ribosomal protein L6 [Candidatus Krumholzibacteria bacterium]